MPKCGSPSFGGHDGKEQWYECDLEAGHKIQQTFTDDETGEPFTVSFDSEHHYVEVDGPSPLARAQVCPACNQPLPLAHARELQEKGLVK